MNKHMFKLGLESLDDAEVVDVSALEKPEEGVEAHLVEVEGQDADLGEAEMVGDQLAADTETLENLGDVVEDAVESGEGMDETAARAVEVGVEAISNRWGFKVQKLGAESFNGANRAQATRVAYEGVMDAVKDAWDTFLKWLQEMINKLRDFWVKYVNAGKAMQKRADKLSDRLDNLGSKVKNGKDKIGGGWTAKLLLDGKIDPEGVIALAGPITSDIKKAAVAGRMKLTSAEGSIKSGSRSGSDTPVEFGKKTSKALSKLVPNNATNPKGFALPGGAYWVGYEMSVGDNSPKVLVGAFAAVPENTGDKKINTPNSNQMKTAIGAINTYGAALEKSITEFRPAQEEMSKLNEAVKSAIAKLKDGKAEEKEANKTALKEARFAVQTNVAMTRAVSAALRNGGFGLIGYVQAGIDAYEK